MRHSGGRQSSRGPEETATAEEVFHQEVRRRRCARGLSRDDVAQLTGYSRQYVSQLEQPSRGVPPRPVVIAVDAALRADGVLIALRDEAAAARDARLRRPRDPERESRRRVHDLLHNRRCDTDLDYLDRMVGELIAMADSLSPRDITDRVLDQQEFVDGLLRTPMLPHQQFRLYMIAGHLAGLLAIALLDQGELAGAGTCCLEAAVFTELTGHEGLRAWTLAVNRLVDEAMRHAELVARHHAGAPGDPLPADAPPSHGPPGLAEPGPLVLADGYPADGHSAGTTGATGTTGAEGSSDPIVRRADELAAGRLATTQERPTVDTEPASPPWHGLADLMTAPGGRASTPRLVALVKGRFARYATTSGRPHRPPSGLSRAFHPPV
ncbi:helix-turn-helix domain-containing protein [Frankia sp. CNm7]|uniref:Helix-turn-helix domain-containing protein n=1 Tax=Frankia nepalensis TaxID=1836974 RepID=A0A937RQ82_9ACTN|nr:helix-turn-helix transcriptional regulator [Frankia nepalensis]MBL7496049.1 helix-turn-helix domain-containing protein [Frankia nepalensis]MBL7511830.1 helix-turn-helix domain-containing protein [Frankia nepalensis]MBL7517225.1 helix-turn-helix domain-containing protein [Frankia nepalensis]MBL7630653.1 helix-turn-helix domain-containing protein [Frankia nepalensis]